MRMVFAEAFSFWKGGSRFGAAWASVVHKQAKSALYAPPECSVMPEKEEKPRVATCGC